MQQHDIESELATAGAQELLSAPSTAHLSYVAKDGTPRVIPVGFFWTGTQVIVSSATTSPKVRGLRDRPDVAVNIDSGDTPDEARSLSIRGRATVSIVDGVVAEYIEAAHKIMDDDAVSEFEKSCQQVYGGQMARIAITPTWVRFYDFGAGRLPGFLHELVTRNGR